MKKKIEHTPAVGEGLSKWLSVTRPDESLAVSCAVSDKGQVLYANLHFPQARDSAEDCGRCECFEKDLGCSVHSLRDYETAALQIALIEGGIPCLLMAMQARLGMGR